MNAGREQRHAEPASRYDTPLGHRNSRARSNPGISPVLASRAALAFAEISRGGRRPTRRSESDPQHDLSGSSTLDGQRWVREPFAGVGGGQPDGVLNAFVPRHRRVGAQRRRRVGRGRVAARRWRLDRGSAGRIAAGRCRVTRPSGLEIRRRATAGRGYTRCDQERHEAGRPEPAANEAANHAHILTVMHARCQCDPRRSCRDAKGERRGPRAPAERRARTSFIWPAAPVGACWTCGSGGSSRPRSRP